MGSNKAAPPAHYPAIAGDADKAAQDGYADDAALVARCLAREAAAQRELFRREFSRVNATLYRVLGSDREAEDLVQDTFAEVFRSLRSFRGEARLSTWIDRIACRTAYQHLSRRRQHSAGLDAATEVRDPGDAPDQRAEAREGVRRLYAVLDGLGAETRLCLTLTLIDGRPLAEVARLLGASAVATRVRAWRGRRALEKAAARDPVLAAYLADVEEDA